jgi:acyl-coenzyme A synthetase/AMP-(fatty) acid ligase
LTRLAESRLGSFKSPKRIFIMEELPKGPSGKIQRLKLPEIVADRMVEI